MIAALLAVAIAAESNAQTLWQTAEVGDTIEALEAKFSDAKRFDETVVYTEGRAADLYIDQRQIGSEQLDVIFVMEEGRLVLVHLLMSEDATGVRPNSVHYEVLEALLARRYGQALYPMPAKITDPAFLRSQSNEFREGDLSVSVNCIFCGVKNASLNIYYEFDTAADAAGL